MARILAKILFFVAVFLLFAAIPGRELHAGQTWKLGHTFPQGSLEDQAIQEFADRVAELSNGGIKIRIFPAMQLGDWTVMQQRVAMGALELAIQPASSQAEKRLSFLYFPYLFKNAAMLRKNLAAGAPFRRELDKLFMGQNIYPIAYAPLFFGGMGCKKLPRDWDIPGAPKAIKIRVPNDPAFVIHAQSMGYLPTPVPMADTFTALQTGMVDGVLGFGANGCYAHYRDLLKYYIQLNDFVQIWPVMINLQLWQKLDEREKAVLARCAMELEERRYRDFMNQSEEYMQKLREAGVEVLAPSPEIINAFAASAREKCWPRLAEKIGREWVEQAMKCLLE